MDVEYLNNPIENYHRMMVIFRNGMATDKYAMGSNEHLGTTSDFAESSLKSEPTDGSMLSKGEDVAKIFEAPNGGW
jgi:hypothetical protein